MTLGSTTLYNRNSDASADCVVAKYTTSGPQWAISLGTTIDDGCKSIALRAGETELIVAGHFVGTLTIDDYGSTLTSSDPGNSQDIYLIKITASTGAVTAAVRHGGQFSDEFINKIQVFWDTIYAVGSHTGLMVLGTTEFDSRGYLDGFLALFSADTLNYVNAVTFGDSGDDVATAVIQKTNTGETFVSGNTESSVYWANLTGLGQVLTGSTQKNGFIIKFDNSTLQATKFFAAGTRIDYTKSSYFSDMSLVQSNVNNGKPYFAGWTTSGWWHDCTVNIKNPDFPAGDKNWLLNGALDLNLEWYIP